MRLVLQIGWVSGDRGSPGRVVLGFHNQPRRETDPLVALAKPHDLKGTEPSA